MQTGTEEFVDVIGEKIRVLRGGAGAPLCILHHDIGNPGWLPLYDSLAQQFRVIVPDLPGWGGSERPEWMRSARDLAVEINLLLDAEGVTELVLVGLGFGGWIAAEMATMNQTRLKRLVLVNPLGIQPRGGEIADQFLLSHLDYVRLGFHDQAAFDAIFEHDPPTEALVQWDIHREMIARIAWKPYLFSQTLPKLLPGMRVPTLVVWGRENKIVPVSAGDQYVEALPHARLEVIPAAGHFLDMEKANDLAGLIRQFAGGA